MSRLSILTLPLLCVLAFPALAQTKPAITVLDFKIDGVSEKEMRSIIEILSSALFNTGKFQVIDVTQRESLLKEVEFSVAECSDESCQLKIGKMISAELIVVGNIGKVGSRFLVSVKMLETETARTHSASDGIFTSLDALVDSIPNIAKKLAGLPTEEPPAAVQEGSAAKKTETAVKPAAAIQPAKPLDWKLIGGISGLASGVLAGGAGGWFLYDALTNGKASVDVAQAAYQASLETNAAANWDAFIKASNGMKNEIYLGIGCAVAGALLGGLGTVLFLLPDSWWEAKPRISMAIVPRGGAALLSLRVRY